TARATDTGGNTTTTAARSVTVDNIAPTATITGRPTSPNSAANSTFTFTSNEAGATFQCRLDVGTSGPCASPVTYTLPAGDHSFWYRWTAQAAGTVTVSTAGSSFDTLLAVYTGTAVSALTRVASNDDVSAKDSTSRLTFNAVSGTTYRVAVDGYRGAFGSVTLNWTGPAPTVDTTPPDTTITSGPAATTSATSAT